MGGWLGGWLYEHEKITNPASNSVEVGAGTELGNMKKIWKHGVELLLLSHVFLLQVDIT